MYLMTCAPLWQYIGEFFWVEICYRWSSWRNPKFLFTNQCPPPRKSNRLWDNVEKYVRVRQATDDVVRNCMLFARCLTKATRSHSEHVIHFSFKPTVVLRTRINVTSHVPCLPCLTMLYSQFILCVVSLVGTDVSKGPTDAIFSSEIC